MAYTNVSCMDSEFDFIITILGYSIEIKTTD